MKNKWIRSQSPYVLLIILGLFTLFFAFWSIISREDWVIPIIGLFALWIFLTLILIIYNFNKKHEIQSVEEFEKTLQGKLMHFKCPHCNGVFALKKTKDVNKKGFRMNCPDCGQISIINPNPKKIVEKIPDKKSEHLSFQCLNCGEGVTVWAEGTEIYPRVRLFSCPYCGKKQSMNIV